MRVHARACAHRGPSFCSTFLPSFCFVCLMYIRGRCGKKTLYIVVLRSARQRFFFFLRVCAACIGDESAVIVKTPQLRIFIYFFSIRTKIGCKRKFLSVMETCCIKIFVLVKKTVKIRASVWLLEMCVCACGSCTFRVFLSHKFVFFSPSLYLYLSLSLSRSKTSKGELQ